MITKHVIWLEVIELPVFTKYYSISDAVQPKHVCGPSPVIISLSWKELVTHLLAEGEKVRGWRSFSHYSTLGDLRLTCLDKDQKDTFVHYFKVEMSSNFNFNSTHRRMASSFVQKASQIGMWTKGGLPFSKYKLFWCALSFWSVPFPACDFRAVKEHLVNRERFL